jgi:hypothetical protein
LYVGLEVSTSENSGSGVACSTPDEGTTHQCVTFLSKVLHGCAQVNLAFLPSVGDKLVPTSVGD